MKKWMLVLAVAVCLLLNVVSAFAGDLFCYTDNPSTTSHFECGIHGNCVWWAAYMRPDIAAAISGSGWNGGQWYDNLVSDGFDVGSAPKVGAIVVFSSGPVGHVAYVAGLGSNGSFSVSEMNWYDSPNDGFTDGINYATYYPGSGNTYHRNNNLGTGTHGNWTLKGFIYRRINGGTNSYCDSISSIWGICWTPSSTDVSCQGGTNWRLYDFEQGTVLQVSTKSYCLESGGMGGGPGYETPATDPAIPNLPDFIVKKTWIETPWGVESYKYGLGESFELHAQSKNIGSGSCSGDITGHVYLKLLFVLAYVSLK